MPPALILPLALTAAWLASELAREHETMSLAELFAKHDEPEPPPAPALPLATNN